MEIKSILRAQKRLKNRMIEDKLIIENKLGIHARPASLLVQEATRFQSDIQLKKDGASADAKSIMSIMMLAASKGTEISITVDGPDEEDAFAAVATLFKNKFNED